MKAGSMRLFSHVSRGNSSELWELIAKYATRKEASYN